MPGWNRSIYNNQHPPVLFYCTLSKNTKVSSLPVTHTFFSFSNMPLTFWMAMSADSWVSKCTKP